MSLKSKEFAISGLRALFKSAAIITILEISNALNNRMEENRHQKENQEVQEMLDALDDKMPATQNTNSEKTVAPFVL